MPLCAYCDRDEILTREHLFPGFLARRSPGYGTYIDHSRPNRALRAVPVIRDVCAKCNNERLSELDAYADQLAAKYFAVLVDQPIHVKFECDTDRLLRWLMKLLALWERRYFVRLRNFPLQVVKRIKQPLNHSKRGCSRSGDGFRMLVLEVCQLRSYPWLVASVISGRGATRWPYLIEQCRQPMPGLCELAAGDPPFAVHIHWAQRHRCACGGSAGMQSA
jgi:hypothetical protein